MIQNTNVDFWAKIISSTIFGHIYVIVLCKKSYVGGLHIPSRQRYTYLHRNLQPPPTRGQRCPKIYLYALFFPIRSSRVKNSFKISPFPIKNPEQPLIKVNHSYKYFKGSKTHLLDGYQLYISFKNRPWFFSWVSYR